MNQHGIQTHCTRRQAIRSLLGGSLVLPGIVSELLASQEPGGAPSPHLVPKAKRVIFLYMSGGVSHVDSFDPKPKLFQDHGKKLNGSFLKRPDWEFQPYGQCGTEVSELFPYQAECVDDMAVIRSMHGDHGNHFEATLGLHTGSVTFARPSIGSWISYGLGTMNQNLPTFVVLAPFLPYAGAQVWSSDFLPARHQGTRVLPSNEPIPNIKRRIAPDVQEMELNLIQSFNQRHQHRRESDSRLSARIQSFETAFGMQVAAPDVFDLTHETDETHDLYGLVRGAKLGFGWQCLVARRMAERGVRFIELIDSGSSGNWDSHLDMGEHGRLARNVDQAISGLLQDLKRRGLLEDTLVVWTTEFGRTPHVVSADHRGREHHNGAFSTWLAGGGIKGGITYGATDDYGIQISSNGVHVHDLHATILHLLGLNHERLTYRHAGRDFRLTDVAGRVVTDLIA